MEFRPFYGNDLRDGNSIPRDKNLFSVFRRFDQMRQLGLGAKHIFLNHNPILVKQLS